MKLSCSIVGEAEAAAVHRILCEVGYLGMGTEVQHFESELAAYLGVPESFVITANTGTSALHLAVEAVLGHGSGAEVLVPSLTFVASFQAISGAGAVPVACDVRQDTATLDLEDAERRLTPRTKAIMPVHYASNPVNLDGVYAFAHKHGLRVIEDAAHAFGCLYKGRKIGSFGDVACFSFDGIKNITCGEGGCIVTSDQAVADQCRDARLLAVEKDTEKRFAGLRSWDFDVVRQGWRCHMSNIMAAVGRVQLTRLDGEFAPKRCALAARYREKLRAVRGLALLDAEPEAFIVPHIFPVRILEGRKEEVIAALDAMGIPTGQHYKPNHLLSFYGGGKESLPVTERLHNELLTLPLHPGLEATDIDAVCAALRKVLA
ncbi:MAG: DegT/DnrJ/EryC1/StrS family aminotransferase [Bilophila sp.]